MSLGFPKWHPIWIIQIVDFELLLAPGESCSAPTSAFTAPEPRSGFSAIEATFLPSTPQHWCWRTNEWGQSSAVCDSSASPRAFNSGRGHVTVEDNLSMVSSFPPFSPMCIKLQLFNHGNNLISYKADSCLLSVCALCWAATTEGPALKVLTVWMGKQGLRCSTVFAEVYVCRCARIFKNMSIFRIFF